MKGLKIQINDEVPVTVAAENFSFVLLDTAMRPYDTGYIYAHGLDYSNSYHWLSTVPHQGRQSENPNRGNLNPISHYTKPRNRSAKRCWHATNNLKRNWKKKV